MMCDNPIETGDDARPRARTSAIENANGNHSGVLGDAVGGAGCCASYMSSVAVAINGATTITNCGKTRSSTSGEFGVSSQNACVDDVRRHART
jgi:hypothetical protein